MKIGGKYRGKNKSKKKSCQENGWLVVFYDISTHVGYSMLNPVYKYILNAWFVNEQLADNF